MGGDSHQNGGDDQCEPPPPAEPELPKVIGQPHLKLIGEQSDYRHLGEVVKQPQHNQCERKGENKAAEKGMPEAVMGREAQKVLEIGREGANQQGRRNEARAAEWERCGAVGESEWHKFIMNDQRWFLAGFMFPCAGPRAPP